MYQKTENYKSSKNINFWNLMENDKNSEITWLELLIH